MELLSDKRLDRFDVSGKCMQTLQEFLHLAKECVATPTFLSHIDTTVIRTSVKFYFDLIIPPLFTGHLVNALMIFLLSIVAMELFVSKNLTFIFMNHF